MMTASIPIEPTYADIEYVKNAHIRQKLDLYLPEPVQDFIPIGGANDAQGPTAAETARPRYPLIIYIHGGAFKFGSKRHDLLPYHLLTSEHTPAPVLQKGQDGNSTGLEDAGEHVVSRSYNLGWAIASLDYRLSGDAVFPAAVQDCKSAVRFLRKNADRYGLDPDRFIAWGESAGAHCASMLGVLSNLTNEQTRRMVGIEFDLPDDEDETVAAKSNADPPNQKPSKTISLSKQSGSDSCSNSNSSSSSVSGVVNYYGPTDFSQMDSNADEDADPSCKHDDITSPESLYLGAQITTVPELVQKANPISYIQARRSEDDDLTSGRLRRPPLPPFFIAHGTRDLIVPFHQSLILVQALQAIDSPADQDQIQDRDRDHQSKPQNETNQKQRPGPAQVTFSPIKGADHVFLNAEESDIDELKRSTVNWIRSVFL